MTPIALSAPMHPLRVRPAASVALHVPARLLGFASAGLLFAAAATAQDSAPTVEKCSRELGTLAVSEAQSHVLAALAQYKLGSPSVMLRMIVQESGCFVVVERGVAMQNLQQERALAQSGQLQGGSNVGGGQMQAADFVMTPVVQFSEDTGGVGGAVGGLFNKLPGPLSALGGLAGGVKFKEAETTLLVADVRSGIQVASAEGKASKMNFSLGGWGWGGLGWASAAGYSKSPEGKLIAASLLDNYNRIVQQVRDRPQLVRSTVQSSQANAAASLPATGSGAAAQRPVAPTAPVAVVAPAGLAPQAPATLPGAALPAALVGAYSGQFGGADAGIFSVMIDPDGRISGVGQTAGNTSFTITGTASANGTVAMSGAGQAGESRFSGIISASSGSVVGTWRATAGTAQGTFNGKKQ